MTRIDDRSAATPCDERGDATSAEVDAEVLLARAYLNRVAEPACVPLWMAVREQGPVAVARQVRAGTADPDVQRACTTRVEHADPHADLEAADRRGIRLIVPESAHWPHFALSCLEAAGARRAARWDAGERTVAPGGEPVPPLALWVRGPLDLAGVGVRTVGIVGSRAATGYGEQVTADLAYGLARRGVEVVSGGAFGIDAVAHRGALAADGITVVVSAAGLDRPYPVANAALFEAAAVDGLLVSESPPGAAPHRGRFLTRNRLIAALSTGIVVVEAARRSGALNTAHHCRTLGRPVMAVPGPITSHASVGCHRLLADPQNPSILVTGVPDVLAVVGSIGDGITSDPSDRPVTTAGVGGPGRSGAGGDDERAGDQLRGRLDLLDAAARRVFDGLPARRAVSVDQLAGLSATPALTVMRVLPVLESAGLAESVEGRYRAGSIVRRAAAEAASRRARGHPTRG